MGINEILRDRRDRAIVKKFLRYLGLNKYQIFYFSNRKHPDQYYFSDTMLIKVLPDGRTQRSGISYNFMMYEAKDFIVKTDDYAGVV